MPRKQLQILQDLCRAHRDGDEARYQEIGREFVRYLQWKGFHLKAQEFERIFGKPTPDPSQEGKPTPEPFPDRAGPLSSPENPSPALPEGEGVSPLLRRGAGGEVIERHSPAGNGEQGALFGEEVKAQSAAEIAPQTAWQVSQGAEVNLVKAQRVLEELRQHPHTRYTGKELADILGYAEKKANGFARLLYYLGLLEETPRRPTPLARLIQRYDPYFEDSGTLWFLHYWISSQPHLVIWNRVVNHLFTRPEFTLDDAKPLFEDQRATHAETSFRTHLRKEFNVCARAYLEAEFRHLHLLAAEEDERFVRLIPAPLPDDILFAAILLYRHRFYPGSVALEVAPLVYPENAPGRLFFLHEALLRESLERLRLAGRITIESFADLDQIKFVRTSAYLDALELYYRDRFG